MKLITALLLISTVGFGQAYEIIKGKTMVHPEYYEKLQKNVTGDDYPFFDTSTKRKFVVHGFHNESHKLILSIWDNYVDFAEAKGVTGFGIAGATVTAKVFDLMAIDGRVYIFYTIEVPDSDEFTLYVLQLSTSLENLAPPKEIQRYTDARIRGREVRVIHSEDKKYLAFVRVDKDEQRPLIRQGNTTVDVKVVNNSFKEVWQKDIVVENGNNPRFVKVVAMDLSGNVFAQVALQTDNTHNDASRRFREVVYAYFWKNGHQKVFDAGPSEGDNYGFTLEVKRNAVLVAGLNRIKRDVRYHVSKVDPISEAMVPLCAYAMPESFVKAAMDSKDHFLFWTATNIIPLANNNWAVTFESRYTFYDGDTFIMAFSDEGKAKWSHVVRKRQTIGDGGKDIFYVPYSKGLLCIYNDNLRNLEKKPEEIIDYPTAPKKPWAIVVQEIDDNGKVKKYAFLGDKGGSDSFLTMHPIRQVDESNFIANISVDKARTQIVIRPK